MFVVPTCRPADPESRQLITSSAVLTGCSVAPTITVKERKLLIFICSIIRKQCMQRAMAMYMYLQSSTLQGLLAC